MLLLKLFKIIYIPELPSSISPLKIQISNGFSKKSLIGYTEELSNNKLSTSLFLINMLLKKE
jgi:hypothetical protein